ncbi:MAG: ROK family protein [Opitutaceae bacterium]|nr:ROK family protein [Opitutaceae bacterium]
MEYALGIDLGGTNVKAIAVTNGARVLAEISLPTGGAESTKWKAAVRRAKGEIETRTGHPPLWIGVVAPGLPARDQRSIAFLPGRLPGLEGLDWQDFFAFERAVPVLNDAQAALLGEVWLGAARDSHNTVLLTLGTGVGGAAQVDGRLLRGHLGRAGHLGHISLNPAGARDIVRTPGSLEDAIGDCTVALRTGGRFSSTAELVAACVRGDSYARRVWHESIRALAAAIASLINVLDPQTIIIGGGIAKCGATLFVPLRRQLARFEWRPGGARVRLAPAELGDRAGAFGSAWHAMNFHG